MTQAEIKELQALRHKVALGIPRSERERLRQLELTEKEQREARNENT